MLVYAHHITPRLQYTLHCIKQVQRLSISVTSDAEQFKNYAGVKINYGSKAFTGNEIIMGSCGLLFETGIRTQHIGCFTVNGQKAFFKTDDADYPFDLFSAIFYLLSRYEEYLPHEKDGYGRYAHTQSLAYKENFLHLPLINMWLQDFVNHIASVYPGFKPPATNFKILPTYDIDLAWSYRGKGWWRNFGGGLRDLLRGQLRAVRDRVRVLQGKTQDPFDSYAWLHQLHQQYQLQPLYFFLLAQQPGKYDKNINPRNAALQLLIRDHAAGYATGIHPSWQSGDDAGLLKEEINLLQTITGKVVRNNRQHYIRFTLPGTYRQLIAAGITDDYSMGYGSINGFRASVAAAYYWYDLEREEATPLLLHPFCFMDANSFYEQRQTAVQALEELLQYCKVVQAVGGTLILLWHNNFLGSDPQFAGWREAYADFWRLASAQQQCADETGNDE
jgi:hypothetical protein